MYRTQVLETHCTYSLHLLDVQEEQEQENKKQRHQYQHRHNMASVSGSAPPVASMRKGPNPEQQRPCGVAVSKQTDRRF